MTAGLGHGGYDAVICVGYAADNEEVSGMTDYVIAAVLLAFIVVVLVLLKRSDRRRTKDH